MTTASSGFSETARFVDETSRKGWQRLKKSSLGFDSAVFDELASILKECSEGNWDGYEALPVSWDAYNYANKLLESLPLGIPSPSIGAEADGELTLEWYRTPRQLLSVSVSADGFLHYAATIGPNRHFGTVVFFDEAPHPIVELIQRLWLQ